MEQFCCSYVIVSILLRANAGGGISYQNTGKKLMTKQHLSWHLAIKWQEKIKPNVNQASKMLCHLPGHPLPYFRPPINPFMPLDLIALNPFVPHKERKKERKRGLSSRLKCSYSPDHRHDKSLSAEQPPIEIRDFQFAGCYLGAVGIGYNNNCFSEHGLIWF